MSSIFRSFNSFSKQTAVRQLYLSIALDASRCIPMTNRVLNHVTCESQVLNLQVQHLKYNHIEYSDSLTDLVTTLTLKSKTELVSLCCNTSQLLVHEYNIISYWSSYFASKLSFHKVQDINWFFAVSLVAFNLLWISEWSESAYVRRDARKRFQPAGTHLSARYFAPINMR